MPVTPTRNIWGLDIITLYDPLTRVPFGFYRVGQALTLDRAIDVVLNEGGNAQGAFGAEGGQPVNTLTWSFKETPDFSWQVLEGATPIVTPAEASGSVSGLANASGTSVFDATTGIASIAVKSAEAGNLRGIQYIFEAADASSVNIYGHTPGPFESDQALLVAAAVPVLDSGGTTDVDSLGITITGGSGTIAMTPADTALLDVKPIHNGFSEIKVGGENVVVNQFGLLGISPRGSDGVQTWIDFPQVFAQGMPVPFQTREFAEIEVTATPLVDCITNSLYTLKQRHSDKICA